MDEEAWRLTSVETSWKDYPWTIIAVELWGSSGSVLAMLGFWLQHRWDKKPLRRRGSFVQFPSMLFQVESLETHWSSTLFASILGCTWHLDHSRKLFWRLLLTRSTGLRNPSATLMTLLYIYHIHCTKSLRSSSMVPETHRHLACPLKWPSWCEEPSVFMCGWGRNLWISVDTLQHAGLIFEIYIDLNEHTMIWDIRPRGWL